MGLIFDAVAGELPLVQRVWSARCDAATTFTSAAKGSNSGSPGSLSGSSRRRLAIHPTPHILHQAQIRDQAGSYAAGESVTSWTMRRAQAA